MKENYWLHILAATLILFFVGKMKKQKNIFLLFYHFFFVCECQKQKEDNLSPCVLKYMGAINLKTFLSVKFSVFFSLSCGITRQVWSYGQRINFKRQIKNSLKMVYIQCVVRFDLVPLSKKSYLKQLLKNINSLGKLDIWLPKLCWLQRPNQERRLSQNKAAKK